MDSVNHWLRAVDAEGLVLARTRVSGDWGFSIGRRDAAVFHFVSEEHAWLRIEDAEPIELAAGDLVVLPRGAPHVAPPVSEIAVRVGYQSEFSFSRAFRKVRGLSPMQARKRAVPGAPG